MKEVALFDFDGTVTFPDTTKFLIIEILKNFPLRSIRAIKYLLLIKVLVKAENIQSQKNRLISSLVQGLSIKEIDNIVASFQKKIGTLTRQSVLDRIKSLDNEGKSILVVTASPSFAVHGFIDGANISVIGTEFCIVDGFYTGKIGTPSCYGYEKVTRIKQWLQDEEMSINFVEAWSDSLSDMPMMELSRNRFWVGRYKKEFEREDPFGNYIKD